MAEHPLRKRFPAMSQKGLEIMDRKLARAALFDQNSEDRVGWANGGPVNGFYYYTYTINWIVTH